LSDIVELTEDDLEALAGLYNQFWGEESDVARMREVFSRLATNPDYIFLGKRHDGRIVGSVMGIVCEELYGQCQPFIVVEDVVVDRDHRRQGVGRALIRELEQRAVERGCSYIILVTEEERVGAHRFYQSMGYDPDKYKGFKKRLTIE
jgi:GNAT superfamily N-acetyltransferase